MLAVLLLVGLLIPASWGTARAATNSQLQIVNLSDRDFWVAWYTDAPVTGSVQYGTSCAGATITSAESRSTGFVHLVDVGGPTALDPDTTYYFKLVDDGVVDDNAGQCYSARTFRPLPKIANPGAVYGTVKADPSCFPPAAGALVTLDVTHGNTTSLPLAAATSPDGTWSVPIGLATDATGNYLYATPGDTMDVRAAAASDDVFATITVFGPGPDGRQQLSTMCLPKAPTPVPPTAATDTPTATPTATLLPTATSTAAPTATAVPSPPTSTPTSVPTSTSMPTATATSVPPTPRPTPRPTKLPVHAPVPEPEGGPGTAGQTSHLKLKAYLVKASVQRGDRQQIVVLTASFAQVTIDVTYPDHGGTFHSSFKADKSGYWRRTWVVQSKGTGRATVLVTVVSGKERRHFHRYFTVK